MQYLGTVIVALAVITLMVLAVRSLIRDKKSGKGCPGCPGCSGCSGGSCCGCTPPASSGKKQ